MGKYKLFLLKEPLIKKKFLFRLGQEKIILINRASAKNNFCCGSGK